MGRPRGVVGGILVLALGAVLPTASGCLCHSARAHSVPEWAQRSLGCLQYPDNLLPPVTTDAGEASLGYRIRILETHDRATIVVIDDLGRVFAWKPRLRSTPVTYPTIWLPLGITRYGALYYLRPAMKDSIPPQGLLHRMELASGRFRPDVSVNRSTPGGKAALLDVSARYVLTVEESSDGDRVLIVDDCLFSHTGESCAPSLAIDLNSPERGKKAYGPDYKRVDPSSKAPIREGLGHDFRVVVHVPDASIDLVGMIGDQLVTREKRQGTEKGDLVVRSVVDGRETARWTPKEEHVELVGDRVVEWSSGRSGVSVRNLKGAVFFSFEATPSKEPDSEENCLEGVDAVSPRTALITSACFDQSKAPRLQLLDVIDGRVIWGTNDPSVRGVGLRADGSILIADPRGVCTVKPRGKK